jgi:hypothetical protein
MYNRIKTTALIIFLGIFPFVGISQKSEITKEYDKFTDKTTFSSPRYGSGINKWLREPVTFHKIISTDSTVSYYLSLYVAANTLATERSGFIVLFTDGEKLEDPSAKIDVEISSGASGVYYEYSAFIPVDEGTMNLFADKILDGFRLYVYESALTKKHIQNIPERAKAILEAKWSLC